ncbi:hypothetical protein TNCV_992671 [Trichonephila clavipes]|nr:hypothetical protein TNCV_992671 [Trichonephila clavipes]
MKKEKRDVPLRTAYSQAGRCGMQPKVKHSLQLSETKTETVETFELVKVERKLLREEKGERERHPTENLDWPKYSKANHTYMNIDVGTRNELGTGPHMENCNLLRNHFGF